MNKENRTPLIAGIILVILIIAGIILYRDRMEDVPSPAGIDESIPETIMYPEDEEPIPVDTSEPTTNPSDVEMTE